MPTTSVKALVVLNSAGGRVVAGAAPPGGTALPLYYSNNNGATWQPATVFSTSSRVGIYALAEGSAYAGGEVDIGGNTARGRLHQQQRHLLAAGVHRRERRRLLLTNRQ